MTTTEPIQGGPSPDPTDPPDGPSQLAALTAWAAGRLWMRFASPSARDVQITSPAEGMHCTTGSGASQIDWAFRDGQWRNITAAHVWSAYTPTLTGVTLGTGGTVSGRWCRTGATIKAQGRFVLGTGGSLSGTPFFGLPAAARTTLGFGVIGTALFTKSAVGYHGGLVRLQTADTAQPVPSYPTNLGATPTTPFTWAAADNLWWDVEYEAAA